MKHFRLALFVAAAILMIAAGLSALHANVQAPFGLQQYIYNSPDNPLNVTTAPSSSTSFGITPVTSATVGSNLILKGTGGNLYSTSVTTGAVSGFLMIFNATTAPADGAVTPVHCWPVPANSTISYSNQGEPPDAFAAGIVDVFSSTGCLTKTASETAFFDGKVQ